MGPLFCQGKRDAQQSFYSSLSMTLRARLLESLNFFDSP